MVVGTGDADLEDSGAGCRRSTEGIDLQVGLPGLAAEVEERKAGCRLVGVVRRMNCALKPLERCWMGMVGGEVMSESVLFVWSVPDRLKWDLAVGSRLGLSRPSLLVYY